MFIIVFIYIGIHELPHQDGSSTNLIIADLHPDLDSKIEKLKIDAIVLRNNTELLSHNKQFGEAIIFASQKLGVRTIILLGHSLLVRPFNNQRNGVSEKRLLNRVADAQRQLQQAKSKLVENLEYCLGQVSSVSQTSSDCLKVIGVFYLRESEIFLLYQPETSTFVPLSEYLVCN